MKIFYKLLLFTFLFFEVNHSFAQRLLITTTINIVELTNDTIELEINATNIDSVNAVSLFITVLDTTKLKFLSFFFTNPAISSGLSNFDKVKKRLSFAWGDPIATANIGNATLLKIKMKRIQCQTELNWFIGNAGSEYADFDGNVLPATFINNVDDSCTVGINNISTNPSILSANVYPNPVVGNELAINYKASVKGIVNAQLFDSMGKLMGKIENQSSELEGTLNFDINNLTKGIYYYNLSLDTKEKTYRYTDKIVIK